MCGICGVVLLDQGRSVDREVLSRMNATLRHRGPDDEGLYVDGGVGLGHRRLSIIDLQTGHQPMANEDETVWIVFNGEIYNCLDLRDELESLGHKFATRSDTEVIVHAYEQFGESSVNRLNGIFAFAIWDSANKRLFMARDRAGIKPLYYAETNGAFLFGSELKAILTYPGVARDIDLVALNQYLTFEYVPTPRTIFEAVKKLGPGHSLTLENGRISVNQYWDTRLARSEERGIASTFEQAARLRETLTEVVRKELISDVPVGVLLSGGIDSSAVAALMARLYPGVVQSFSVAFDDRSFDESTHARLVARHVGTDHHEITLTPKMMLDLIPHCADFLDEPLGDSSIIPTYLLSKFTRQHVKVALGGDGGDELFAGYSTLQAHRLSDWYHRLAPGIIGRRLVPWLVNRFPVSFNNISFDFKLRRFVAGQGSLPVIRHHIWMGSFTTDQRCQLLGPLARGLEGAADELAVYHAKGSGAQECLNQILYCDMKLYLEGDILPKVDRASMANALEVRVPLLNQTLMEHVEAIPVDLKLHRLTTKYILRKAVEDLLPASILQRGKKGFNMPVAKWLTGPLRPLAEDMLSEDRLRREGLFEPRYVRSLMDDHLAGRCDNRKLLWTLLVFELWHDKWAH